jgi:hypothetical protein
MKLFQIIANAQGSHTFFNMGQAFGFSDELMAQAVRYFIPPMVKAIERRAQTSEGLLSVLEFLGSRRYGRFLEDPRIFGHDQVLKEGERVLGYLFAREERINRLVENRAQRLPIEPAVIHSLLPYIAVMVIGAIEVRTRRPLSVVWHRITKGATDDRAIANPYLALAGHLRRQEREQKDQRRRRLFTFLGVASSPAPPAKELKPAVAPPALLQSA